MVSLARRDGSWLGQCVGQPHDPPAASLFPSQLFEQTRCRYLSLLVATTISCPALADPRWVGQFSETDTGIPAPWKIEYVDQRVPPTQYTLRKWDGVMAIEASAHKSMALLARSVAVNLKNADFVLAMAD